MDALRDQAVMYWLGVAEALGPAAPCRRRKVGAVIVGNWQKPERGRILGHGVNRGPESVPTCLKGGCPRGKLSVEECPPETPYDNCHSRHAEAVAIEAASFWLPGPMGTLAMFVSDKPCPDCCDLIWKSTLPTYWRKPNGYTANIPGRIPQ
jgi:dCMP deaminase